MSGEQRRALARCLRRLRTMAATRYPLYCHFWLSPPLHGQTCTGVPGLVELPGTSRHDPLEPFTSGPFI
jgi:hypothetical protein